jgi:hypothetical protein
MKEAKRCQAGGRSSSTGQQRMRDEGMVLKRLGHWALPGELL